MELLNHISQQGLTEHTYVIDHPTEKILIYKEWVDERGKVIDFTLSSKTGILYDYLENADLFDDIHKFVDNLGLDEFYV